MKKSLESRQESEQEDPDQLMNLSAFNAFFANHGYSGSVYGDSASLKAIKKKDIVNFYKRYFTSANMTISISTDLDESIIKETIKKFFSGFPGRESSPPVAVPVKASTPSEKKFFFKKGLATPPNKEHGNSKTGQHDKKVRFSPERSQYFLKKEKKQTLICFTALLPRMDPENFTLAFMLENLLGKGIGSRLWHLRMKHELAYGFEASLIQLEDAGILKIHIKTGNKKKEEAYRVLKNLVSNLYRTGITAEELNTAKMYSKANVLRMNETKEKRALHQGYFVVLGPGFGFLQDFFSKVDQLSLETINSYIKKVLKPGNLVEIVIGPVDITPATD